MTFALLQQANVILVFETEKLYVWTFIKRYIDSFQSGTQICFLTAAQIAIH